MIKDYKLFMILDGDHIHIATQDDTGLMTKEQAETTIKSFSKAVNISIETVDGDLIGVPEAKMRDCFFYATNKCS